MTTLTYIGSLALCAIIVFIFCYFIPKGKIRKVNQEIINQEEKLKLEIKALEAEKIAKTNEIELAINQEKDAWERQKNSANLELVQQTQNLQLEVRGLEDQKQATQTSILELQEHFKQLSDQADEAAKKYKQDALTIANKEIDDAKKEAYENLTKAKEAYQTEYLQTLQELTDEFQSKIQLYQLAITNQTDQLTDLSNKVNAAVEVNKRAELEKNKKDYYRLVLSPEDIEEIKKIRSIEPYLRDKEPLNKVIWKSYYEKPYTDLVGRVIGQGRKTGIYKITNLDNQMCYIGQALDLAERWRQHIKRGVGAETPTRNKLYPAMLSIGVENFTFEVIEECASNQLNAREDFWQKFYHAQDYGYSIK